MWLRGRPPTPPVWGGRPHPGPPAPSPCGATLTCCAATLARCTRGSCAVSTSRLSAKQDAAIGRTVRFVRSLRFSGAARRHRAVSHWGLNTGFPRGAKRRSLGGQFSFWDALRRRIGQFVRRLSTRVATKFFAPCGYTATWIEIRSQGCLDHQAIGWLGTYGDSRDGRPRRSEPQPSTSGATGRSSGGWVRSDPG